MNDLTCSSLSSMKCLCLRISLRFTALPNISAQPPHSHHTATTQTHTHTQTQADTCPVCATDAQSHTEALQVIWRCKHLKLNRHKRIETSVDIGWRCRADPVDRSSWLSRSIRRTRSQWNALKVLLVKIAWFVSSFYNEWLQFFFFLAFSKCFTGCGFMTLRPT